MTQRQWELVTWTALGHLDLNPYIWAVLGHLGQSPYNIDFTKLKKKKKEEDKK